MKVTRTTNEPSLPGATRCRLRVVLGPDAGTEVDIPPQGIVIGAGSASDIALHDSTVSSRHCAVRAVGPGFEVSDLGSKNGTFYDGAGITKATVPAGATLRLGESLVQLLPTEELVAIDPSSADHFGGLLGESVAMRRVYALFERVASARAPVLLIGESGTGKEVCARALHAEGSRRDGPFVVFDCAAASESLVESDLFGHVRGAFTGAHEERPGAFALADGGTLFLDEIGELPPRLQPKLLRALESGETQPLGGRKPVRHDVRLIAATNRDLRKEVARGTFRGDVYFRLAVVEVHLPPLRERMEDVPTLLAHFLRREGASTDNLSSPNLDRMSAYAWPGNVRELRNVVSRAVALATPGSPFAKMPLVLGAMSAESAVPRVRVDKPFAEAKAAWIEDFERAYVTELLARHGHNLAEAARVAGVERKHLYRVMARIGLARPESD